MSIISTDCPRCRRYLEIPDEFDNVICPGCGTAYWIRRHLGAVNLSEIWPDSDDSRRAENAASLVDSRMSEIGELIEEAELEIEGLRSREQSAPLQKGCAFFGLIMTVILVIALFMLVGRSYFGGWLFFAALAVVVLLSFLRIRRNFVVTAQAEALRRERIEAEADLAQLRAEGERLRKLKARLESGSRDS